MTIEQEFFKSFNIPTKFYTTVNLGDLDNNYQEVSANTLQELFDDNAFWIDTYIEDIKDFHDWEEKYPSITPEIVLGLIKILLTKYHQIEFATDQGEYRLSLEDNNFEYKNSDTSKGIFSFEDAILSMCIKCKDEIQDQVRELFNAM